MAQSSVEITVPEDIAERIRAKVASEPYASEREIIGEGLLARGAGGGHRALAEGDGRADLRSHQGGPRGPDTDRWGLRRLAQALWGEEDAEDFL